MIVEIEANSPRTITLQEYCSVGGGLKWDDTRHIRKAMAKCGYLIAMATTKRGDVVPARFAVAAEICQPIVLTEAPPGVWTFSTSAESWRVLAGRGGSANVEDGVLVSVCVTRMN